MPWPGVYKDSVFCVVCGWLANGQEKGDECPDCGGSMRIAGEEFPDEKFDENDRWADAP